MPRKRFHRTKAQIITEQAVFLSVIVGVIVALSFLIKRAIQGKIKDTHTYMIDTVRSAQSEIGREVGRYDMGIVYNEYEPYYSASDSAVHRESTQTDELAPGGQGGGFTKTIDDKTTASTQSTQLPPGMGESR